MPPSVDTLVVIAFTALRSLAPTMRAPRVEVGFRRLEEGMEFSFVTSIKAEAPNPLVADAEYWVRLAESGATGLAARLGSAWTGSSLVLLRVEGAYRLETVQADGRTVGPTFDVPAHFVDGYPLHDALLDALRESAVARAQANAWFEETTRGDAWQWEPSRIVLESGRSLSAVPIAAYIADEEHIVWPWNVDWLEPLAPPELMELASSDPIFKRALEGPLPCGEHTARLIAEQLALSIGARCAAVTDGGDFNLFVAVTEDEQG